ncbi:MAG: V-type ATP synthase subunit F [Planctomycetota bacterium]|jgi:V/A-type H+-transporting ATPase subunit F
MARMIALGPVGEALPYAALGAEIRETSGPAEMAEALGELARDHSVALVLVAEDHAEQVAEELAEFRERSPAALLVLPGSTGSRGLALAQMKKFLEHAIGVDLITKG